MDFELLPDLVLHRVFSFFDLAEKSRLKRVCKRWLFLLQASEAGRTLVVYEMRASLKWLDFVKSIDRRDVCEVAFNNETLSYLSCKPTLANKQLDRIKKFYAFGIRSLPMLVLDLAHLKQLEILQIENCANVYDGNDPTEREIDLPNLCFLSIKNCSLEFDNMFPRLCFNRFFNTKMCTARIRSPNLTYCALPNFEEDAIVQLECFEKIRYIKCDFFDGKTAKKAINLETLVCKRFELPFGLGELPKLKEIALFPYVMSPQSVQFEWWCEAEKHLAQFNFEMAFKNLQEQRASLSRSDLKIVVNGFEESSDELSHLNKENWYESFKLVEVGFHVGFTAENAELIASNYGKLVRPLPFRTKANYTNLAKAFDFKIPANFFEKFPEIASVSVSEPVENASHLLNFLQNCSNLQFLQLKNCLYNQQFYLDLLHFQSLRYLAVQELSGQIDFSFILQFVHLIRFVLQSDKMPVDLAYKFLKEQSRYFAYRKLNSNVRIRVVHHSATMGNWLFIDGKLISLQDEPRTLDNFFLYLRKHEYQKFFI